MPIKVLMPALSPTMTEGNLAAWHVKEGDTVSSGDVIAEIETDKATMEVEAVDEGVVGKIVVAAGTEAVPVNDIIAVLLEDGEDAASVDAVLAAGAAPAPAPAAAPAGDGGRVFASPLARRMAKNAGLDLAAIKGSGPHGRVIKIDIEAALAGGVAAALPFEPDFELVPHTTMRKVIAARLSESKQQVPHFYLTIDCEIDGLLGMRKQLNDKADGAYKLSVNDMIIKAVGIALRKVPEANASWTDEGAKLYTRADVAVAVAIEGGLITPVVRDAGNKGLETVSTEMKALAQKARDGKLQPEEFQGGTFSLSNLGMFGIKQFEAVINPPQGCILAVGAGERRPVVKDGALAVATVMTCSLSVDHRVVDGAIGAQFLAAFKKLIEDPVTMLL